MADFTLNTPGLESMSNARYTAYYKAKCMWLSSPVRILGSSMDTFLATSLPVASLHGPSLASYTTVEQAEKRVVEL